MIRQSLEELQRLFAEQAARVEKMVNLSVETLIERQEKLAYKVINEFEPQCNKTEMIIESKTAEILALYCPKAREMRRIIAIIKANSSMERIGDQAVNIAQSALSLISAKPVKPLIDIPRMAKISSEMVRHSLEAFLQENLELANEVLEQDNLVDKLEEQVARELITYMIEDPRKIESAMKLILISRNLERVADLATNIAEDDIYYITGQDIRHPSDRPVESEDYYE